MTDTIHILRHWLRWLAAPRLADYYGDLLRMNGQCEAETLMRLI